MKRASQGSKAASSSLKAASVRPFVRGSASQGIAFSRSFFPSWLPTEPAAAARADKSNNCFLLYKCLLCNE